MFFLRTSGFYGNRNNYISNQLARPLIKTDNWALRIIRLFIKIQHVLHMPDKIARHLSYAPASLQPRFNFIFFNSLCTLIWDIESTTSISTSLSARSLTVHFDLPTGGSEQARRVNCASILPSILGGAPLRAFSCSAESKPLSQYLVLIRLTVDLLTFNASAIVSSSHLSSAKRSILARVRLLAEDLPLRRYCSRSSRSCSFKLTMCSFFLPMIYI